MRRVHILHGFNVRDSGESTVGMIVPELTRLGYDCIYHKWGWRGLFGCWAFNRKLVERLKDKIEEGDDVVGHSDGCNIAMWAAEDGAEIRRLILVNPALDNDKELPDQIEHCAVFCDPQDVWVRISSWIPFNRWGRMGATGPTSQDSRYTTIRHPYGHSGIFKKYNRYTTLARNIAKFLSINLEHAYRNN